MEKLFTDFSLFFSLVGVVIIELLGGADQLLATLLFCVVVDYFTGLCKATITKKLSSEIGFLGIFKKLLIFTMVSLALVLENLTENVIPLRNITILFYISNESLSLLENIGEFLPIPHKIKELLLQLQEKK